jgi:hypothetical protein
VTPEKIPRPALAGHPWLAALAGGLLLAMSPGALAFDARAFGSKGDGRAVDSPAINAAIEAASRAGGGTVHLPAGTSAGLGEAPRP